MPVSMFSLSCFVPCPIVFRLAQLCIQYYIMFLQEMLQVGLLFVTHPTNNDSFVPCSIHILINMHVY